MKIAVDPDIIVNEANWNKKYLELLNHQNISKKIHKWLEYQKTKYQQNKLPWKHQEKLEAVGIDFICYQAKLSFEQRILQLQQYKNIHQHVCIKKQEYHSLYNFIKQKRNLFCQGILPIKHYHELVALGVRLDYLH